LHVNTLEEHLHLSIVFTKLVQRTTFEKIHTGMFMETKEICKQSASANV